MEKYGAETKLKFMEHLLQELNKLEASNEQDKWKFIQVILPNIFLIFKSVLEAIRLCAREGVSLNPLDVEKASFPLFRNHLERNSHFETCEFREICYYSQYSC